MYRAPYFPTSPLHSYGVASSSWLQSAAGKDIVAKYPRAYMAPPEVQDAVARKEVQRILDQNGGNVKAVPAPPGLLLAGVGALALLGRARLIRRKPATA